MDPKWYHVCWPRLTAKRVEPVVSISWASCSCVIYIQSTLHIVVNFWVFVFYTCCFVIVNKPVIHLWCFVRYKGTKISIFVTWRRPRPLRGRFMVHTQEGFVLCICIKSEADSSSYAKVIRVPNFRNWVTWPGHAHLGVGLFFTRRRVRPIWSG